MPSPLGMPLARHLTLLVAAFVFAAVSASAQLAPVSNPSGIATASADESSSVAEPLVADGAAPGASGAAAQEDHGHGYHEHGGMFSHMAFEAGAGFNGPIGNDTPYITWGGNFTGGAGFHFSKRFSVLGEFQFIDDKLPGAFVAIGGGTTGDAHIISITGSPVFDLFPKSSNSVYLTGGYGYYHKSTNFNVEVCCDYYGYPETLTANSFTSNQQGANIGVGFTHRLGGVYGDSTTKLFAEARYLYVHTPPITQNNGLGTTELIPVTLGVRW